MRRTSLAIVFLIAAASQAFPTIDPTVRELSFDPAKCGRTKEGSSVDICMTQAQLEKEIGQELAKQLWAKIDPKREAVVVIGLNDTFSLPQYDGLLIRKKLVDGNDVIRFQLNPGNGHRFQFFMGYEWGGRCKVYAAPRNAAIGLDDYPSASTPK